MKSNRFVAVVVSLLLMVSCHGGNGHSHSHEEEGHIHEAEAAHTHAGHDHEGKIHNHEAEHASNAGSDEIVITPERANAAGIISGQVLPGDFYGVIPVGGVITGAPGDETEIVANVSGIISFLRPVTEGLYLSRGTPLLAISGARIMEGDQAERARVAYESAKEEYERASSLVKEKIVSEKDFNAIKAIYENARIAYEAIPQRGEKGVELLSPAEGYVKRCLVKEGDYVSAGSPVATLVKNNRLYLKADLPERYYPLASKISSAKFKTSYSNKVYNIEEMGGRLIAFGKNLADNSPYIPVTFEFNGKGEVIPGTYAEVCLLTEKRENVISLPVSAITEEQGVNFVYLKADESCYKKHEVRLGESNGERVEILSGLHGGEQVVTQGAIHVRLASAGNTIPAHTHQH